MLKSHYSDPAIDGHGFVNHIHHVTKDMGVYPGTTEPLIECYKIEMISNLQATSGTGAKPRNIALFRKVLGPHQDPSTGAWDLVRMWREGTDYDDASAAGSVDVSEITGDVHIVMSFGKKNDAGALVFQPWEATVARGEFAPSIVRPPAPSGGAATDPRMDALVSQLGALSQKITEIETALGNLGSVGLSSDDAELLAWVKTYRAALHGA